MEFGEYALDPLRKDEEFILYRGQHRSPKDGEPVSILLLVPASQRPAPETLNKLEHEYSLKSELEAAWAVRPLALSQRNQQKVLVLENPGGEPLDRLIQGPMEVGQFLRLAVGLASAVTQLHKRGLIHKDLKPTNVLIDSTTGRAWLRGFGIASRLPRERQSPGPPEFIAGSLPYMAPEQTGRMNRSIDARSDLYALGVTLYQMLTGSLPFTATDPMEWVHCHIARQPVAPSELLKNVPVSVSAIVMKLLAKTPENRYQTAFGAESDLRRCLAAWETHGHIDEFDLAEHDTSDRLLIPEKLYGREHEIDRLLASFDRVVASGQPEWILISGYSGIGKSSLVNELHKALIPARGLFASGKFDQYKRDIPYATLAQAFESLIRSLLSKNEAELSSWRDALLESLSPNGQLIVDLVPELELIIGEQPPVPELPAQDAQRRFHLVLRRFIGAFATPEHPLALFLDDLQWLDTATLDVLQDLLTQADVHHLMLIGAYRDNAVNSTHPLMRRLEAIRQAGGKIQEMVLAPFPPEALARLIADSLHCSVEDAAPLAQLIHEKTAGNPFFVIQFISALAEEALLKFDHGAARWCWDLNLIHAKGYTDNVSDLMVAKLNRLPFGTQNALQQLASLGNSAEFTTVRMLYEGSTEEMHRQLWEAVRAGLIFRSENSYTFLHDRVQEAAYSLIPEESRVEAHLRIGRLLEAHTAPDKREEAIFEIVNQLNRGATLITAPDEREQLAELNSIAGKRAMASTAYTSALKYLTAGADLLGNDSWERRHELTFALELHRAECEFLTGRLAAAEEHLTNLASRAANTVELATVTCLRVDLYTALDQTDRAVAVCLDYLRRLDVEWSPHPTQEEVEREYERIWSRLGSRKIEDLIELPLMSDRTSLATLGVLTKVLPSALFTDANLLSLAICRAVNLSLEQGNSDGSCVAYVWLGQVAGPHFGNYKAGFEFGQLGYELVEKCGLQRFQARTYMVFGSHVMPWTNHVRACRELIHRSFEVANKIGDISFAVYSRINLNTNLLAAGDPLLEEQRAAENGLEFAQKAGFGFPVDVIAAQLGLIRTLRGLTSKFGSFDDAQFDELRFEHHLASDRVLAQPVCFYWIRKLQARFFSGDYGSAFDASLKAKPLLWTAPSNLEMAEYHFYAGLCRAALWDSESPHQKQEHLDALATHLRQLEIWAENCPENFESRAALLRAEIARIEGRDLDAMHLYEHAIGSARENSFVHVEGVANEVAARFFMARGFEKIAYAYLREARYCYLRWGATGKVQQLESLYPRLREEELVGGPTNTIAARVEHLDLATVIKVSQAVSGEMDLDKLIDTLMRTAIEHAGAERGLLIISRKDDLQVEAEATTGGANVTVRLRKAALSMMPESIIHYVVRTRETVILNDAAANNAFSTDAYIRQRRARSILCLPLVNQGKLTAVLYLENTLAPGVFTPDRIVILKLLASQAAISLENSRLYSDLEQREAKIRRLVEANIVGIFTWDLDGRIIDANDAFLHIVRYEREDVVSGRLRWTDLTPPEWLELDTGQRLPELRATGSLQPFEKEYFRKDGSRVPVLIGATSFEETGSQGLAFVLDLSEQKRSEENHRIVVETASDVVISMDESGLILLANPATKRVFGYESAELIGKPMTTLMPEFMRKLHETGLRRYVATGQRHLNWQGTEFVGLRKSGEEFPVEISFGEQIRNGHRVFTGFLRDISQKKKAEEALRASELSLRLIVDSIPGLVTTTTAAGEIELANRQFLDYVGMTLVESKDWRPRVHPDDRALVATLWSNSVERGQPYEAEYRLCRADGVYRWFHARGLPLRDKEGRILRWYLLLTDIDERKKAEENLRRSEAYLSEAQRLTHTGSWVWQVAGGDPLHLSEEWYRVFGFEIAEGMPGWEKRLQRVHPADRSNWQEVIERAIREKSEYDMQYRILLPDGTVKWIHAVGHPVFNASGDLVQFTGTSMDITERKHAENTLRRSEGYLAEAQRLAQIGSWAWEIPSREALYISEEWYRIYGFDPKDGMLSWEQRLQRIHPEDRARFQAVIDRAIAEKSDYDLEFRIVPPHSPGRYIHSVGHPVLSPSGELLQFVGVSMDISESKRAEEAFRLIVVGTAATTGSDFFRSLVQHLAQALRARYAFVTTCDDQKHARTLAFWKGDSFGENFEFDIADTPCEKVLHGQLCHYREGLQRLFPLDKVLADWQADSYLGVPMLDGSNRVIGHMAILDDRPMEADLRAIDLLKIFASRAAAELKRQRAEDELQASLQERERLRRAQAELAHISRVSTMGELTASLAHEIKQPIGAAVTNAEACLRLLDRDQPDLAEAREAVLEMVRDARRAAAIIDRVRSLYRKGSSELEAVDVNEVIGEMALMLQNEANRHSVTIRTELARSLPTVMADRIQLQQVLMNLMLNGIEAMRDTTGELSIKSQLTEDGQLLISVTDTGVGLPTQNLDRIFDAFFTTKSQGTGLGLAITRSIVESHGGRVWATASSGHGASFHFTLPSRVAMSA